MRKAGAPTFSPSLRLSTHRVVRTEARGGGEGGSDACATPLPQALSPRVSSGRHRGSAENPREPLQQELLCQNRQTDCDVRGWGKSSTLPRRGA